MMTARFALKNGYAPFWQDVIKIYRELSLGKIQVHQ